MGLILSTPPPAVIAPADDWGVDFARVFTSSSPGVPPSALSLAVIAVEAAAVSDMSQSGDSDCVVAPALDCYKEQHTKTKWNIAVSGGDLEVKR